MEHSIDHKPGSRTRRWLLKGTLFASLSVATPLRAMLVQDVAADKKSKLPSKKKRLDAFREICGVGGGTVTIDAVKPGGTTATCTGSAGQTDRTCTFTSKATRCHNKPRRAIPNLPTHTFEPDSPLADPGDVPDHPLG